MTASISPSAPISDKKVGIPGEDSRNVMSAVVMLRAIGDNNMPNFHGKQVVVIGGGNVAMDVVRSSIRLGADKVTCVYRRRTEDMTALPDEIEGALAEGAELMTLAAPVRIEADENHVARALWVQPQIIGEVGKDGRPRPNKADLPEQRIPADVIVVAIGQGIEMQGFEQAGVPDQARRHVRRGPERSGRTTRTTSSPAATASPVPPRPSALSPRARLPRPTSTSTSASAMRSRSTSTSPPRG